MKTSKRWSSLSTNARHTALGLCAFGAASATLSGAEIPVLLYGQIGDTAHNEFWVTTDNFTRHMQGLKDRGYNTLTLDQYIAIQEGTATAPEKPILLTFTNGYRNLQDIVDPVLANHNFNATAMILPGRVGGDSSWDEGDINAGAPVVQHLTWDQLRALQATGRWDFGSHSSTHPRLTTITNTTELNQEIAGSKQAIESELNGTVRAFSYPYGAHSADIRQRVESAGYDVAFGVRDAVSHNNLYALPRFDIDNSVTVAQLFGPQYLNDAGDENYHPADANQDWKITISEVTAYGALWRQGQAPLANVTRAGFIWRQGTNYTYDASGTGSGVWVPNN